MLKEWMHLPRVLFWQIIWRNVLQQLLPGLQVTSRALVTMHRQRDKGLTLVDVSDIRIAGSRGAFPRVLKQFRTFGTLARKVQLRRKHEFIINNRNLHRS